MFNQRNDNRLKDQVKNFWNRASCGEVYAQGATDHEYYSSHREMRYRLEPYIFPFAKFYQGAGKDVLEVGVGMGADHLQWAKSNPRSLTGIDLTPKAIEHTERRLKTIDFHSDLQIADAERLPFSDNSFDLVYSWGVVHHSPDTHLAAREIWRVLRPGGSARVMIYHKYSLTGYMLWIRYALLTGRPWRSLTEIYANYLESPGTKAFSQNEARKMFMDFSRVDIAVQLSFGDLLQGDVGKRHQDYLLLIAKKFWPRKSLKRVFAKHGLLLLIEAVK